MARFRKDDRAGGGQVPILHDHEPGADPVTEDVFHSEGHRRPGLAASQDEHAIGTREVDGAIANLHHLTEPLEAPAKERAYLTGGERGLPDGLGSDTGVHRSVASVRDGRSRSSGDGRHDRHLVAILESCLRALEEPDVFLVDVEIDKAPDRTLVVEQPLPKTRELALEILDEIAHVSPLWRGSPRYRP